MRENRIDCIISTFLLKQKLLKSQNQPTVSFSPPIRVSQVLFVSISLSLLFFLWAGGPIPPLREKPSTEKSRGLFQVPLSRAKKNSSWGRVRGSSERASERRGMAGAASEAAADEGRRMEGWLYLIRSNRFGLQYSRKRYFVLEENCLHCFKAVPSSKKEVIIFSQLWKSMYVVLGNWNLEIVLLKGTFRNFRV